MSSDYRPREQVPKHHLKISTHTWAVETRTAEGHTHTTTTKGQMPSTAAETRFPTPLSSYEETDSRVSSFIHTTRQWQTRAFCTGDLWAQGLGAYPRTCVLGPLLKTQAVEHLPPSFVRARRRPSEQLTFATEETYKCNPHLWKIFSLSSISRIKHFTPQWILITTSVHWLTAFILWLFPTRGPRCQ